MYSFQRHQVAKSEPAIINLLCSACGVCSEFYIYVLIYMETTVVATRHYLKILEANYEAAHRSLS